MKIIPALYIQGGQIISLYKGNENSEKKRYAKSPHQYAALFHKQGARTLFAVDLNGTQRPLIPKLKSHFPEGELWWAGEIRTLEELQEAFTLGADRVILGQSAESIHKEALQIHGPEKLMIGLQFNHYDKAVEVCETIGQSGFKEIIMKDLNAEGTLFNPNYDLMEKCVYFSEVEVFASGGVGSIRDLQLLEQAGVKGVIIARALYENQINLSVALNQFESV
jgi:phosphoribosylformimino-5-aminoimidazole carboxamide ribotide isomerase